MQEANIQDPSVLGVIETLCFQLLQVIGSSSGMGLLPWSSFTLPCFWSPLSSEDPKPHLELLVTQLLPLPVCGFA